MSTNIPEGQSTVMPYLCVRNAVAAIEFYKSVLGATEVMRLAEVDGKVGHAELAIGESHVMLSDEFPDSGALSPETIGGSSISLHLYVADVDDVMARAAAAGATIVRPPADQFYGDRSGKLVDPFGHVWMITTHKEDMPAEEMQRRYDEILKEKS